MLTSDSKKKTWTNCSTVSLLWFDLVILNQTLVSMQSKQRDTIAAVSQSSEFWTLFISQICEL